MTLKLCLVDPLSTLSLLWYLKKEDWQRLLSVKIIGVSLKLINIKVGLRKRVYGACFNLFKFRISLNS